MSQGSYSHQISSCTLKPREIYVQVFAVAAKKLTFKKDLFHFWLERYNKALKNRPHRQTMIFVLLDPQHSLKQRWTKLPVSLKASQETWRRTEGLPKFKSETHSVLTVTYRRGQFSELVPEIKQFTGCQQNHVQISHHERCKQQVLFLNNYLW